MTMAKTMTMSMKRLSLPASLGPALVALVLVVCAPLLAGGCTLDSFMFPGTPQDGPYDFSGTTIPSDRYDPEGTFVTAEDGTRVHLHFVRSSGDVPARAGVTIFYCHGNTDHILHYWDRVEIFYHLGYQVLIYDYRGYGRTEGTPTEAGLYLDSEAALAHTLTLPEVDPARLVFYGYSLGCAPCTEIAKRHTDQPTALVLEAPFRSVEDLIEDGALASLDVGMLSDLEFDNYAKIDRVGAPLLVMHGSDDTFLKPEYGRALYEKALPPKAFWLAPGGQHGTVPGDEGSARRQGYEDTLTAFLDQYVP